MISRLAICVSVSICAAIFPAETARAADVDYDRDIKPLLREKCYRCHGALKQESGLRLDTTAALTKGGDRGAGLTAGKPADSLLIAAVTGSGDIPRMPLDGHPLTDEQLALFKSWIESGAKSPADEKPVDPLDHWSFRPVTRPALPTVRDPTWPRGGIDAFIAAKHEAMQLAPRPEAERVALLRRITLDLTGLSPSADEIAAHLADASPDAYERLVDQLLASPQHGERWARHWMDVWRYSDWAGWTDGGQIRDSQPHIWRWRDWIVQSLNRDLPYDKMVSLMLAGDELAPEDESALAATGFLARNYKMLSRETWMQDTVEHTGKAFLGLTLNCARCHDHIYDPITQEDHYRFRAIFEPHNVRIDRVAGELDAKKDGVPRVFDADASAKTQFFIRGDDRTPDANRKIEPGMPGVFGSASWAVSSVKLPTSAYSPDARPAVRQTLLQKYERDVAEARNALAELIKKHPVKETPMSGDVVPLALIGAQKNLASCEARLAALQARIAADDAKLTDSARARELARAAAAAERRATAAEAEEAVVSAEVDEAMLGQNADEAKKHGEEQKKKRRAEAQAKLAKAIKGLIDPGDKYEPLGPTYPKESTGRRSALARWIARADNPLTARVAVNHLWNRHFGQALVPTTSDFGKNGKPPVNPPLIEWLADEFSRTPAGEAWSMRHLHRLIVTSSTYRQSAAFDEPSHKIDPDNIALWRWPARRLEAETVRDLVLHVSGGLDLAQGGPDIDCKLGLTSPRRSVYFRHAPEKQMEFLQLFDAAAPTQCYERTESVMPQQALALANSRIALSAARRLARHIASNTQMAQEADPFTHSAFLQILSRPPREAELTECRAFLTEQSKLFTDKKAELVKVSTTTSDIEKPTSDPAIRARENLVHALLNHHEFVTTP